MLLISKRLRMKKWGVSLDEQVQDSLASLTEAGLRLPDYVLPAEARAHPDFVSDYAPAGALHLGQEEDAPNRVLSLLSDLQNQSSPVGNGWSGQDELPLRPEQEAINAAAGFGQNDSVEPSAAEDMNDPVTPYNFFSMMNLPYTPSEIPVLNSIGYEMTEQESSVRNPFTGATGLVDTQHSLFNRLVEFIAGGELWQAEDILQNYILPNPRIVGQQATHATSESYKCGEDLFFFEKSDGRISCEEPEEICMRTPGKDCETLSSHPGPNGRFVSCVTFKNGEHDRRSIRYAFAFGQTNKSYLCMECSRVVCRITQFSDECVCVTTLKDAWLFNKHMVNGWKQVASAAARMSAWRVRKGREVCLFCNRADEDVNSGLWVCKCCHTPVSDKVL
jgi:hypothetical protein